MQTSGATGFGTQLAGAAGLGALGARYDPTQFQADQFGGDAAQQYMSPYMQNVVDIQQREAQRQGDIAGTQLASQATKSGAFGGGRQAIIEAERQRNLGTQLGDIRAKMGRYLDIIIPMHKLNDDLIERIATTLKNGTGKTQVRMRVMHEQSELLLPSNNFNKVNIEAESLKALEQIAEIEFEVCES
jgi:hypothetical protein